MDAPTARHWVFGSVGVVMLGLIGYFGQARIQGTKSPLTKPVTTKSAPSTDKAEKATKLLVEIRGAVKAPGIYEVEEGTRTRDLFLVAGGLLPAADTSKMNLVRVLKDGVRVDVPFKSTPKQPATKRTAPSKSKSASKAKSTPHKPPKEVFEPVSINRASREELAAIPGITPLLANGIYDLRMKREYFLSINDLLKVEGMTKRKLEALSKWLKL